MNKEKLVANVNDKIEEVEYFFSQLDLLRYDAKTFRYNLGAFVNSCEGIKGYILSNVNNKKLSEWFKKEWDSMPHPEIRDLLREYRRLSNHIKPIGELGDFTVAPSLPMVFTTTGIDIRFSVLEQNQDHSVSIYGRNGLDVCQDHVEQLRDLVEKFTQKISN